MTVTHWFQLAYTVAVAAAALYVLPRGGAAERWALLWLIACSALSIFVTNPKLVRWHGLEFGLLAVDTLLLAALIAIMLRSQRLWPIPAVAFQLVAVVTHVAMAIDHEIVPRAYSWAQGFWAYPIMALIAAGTARRRRLSAPGGTPRG